MQQTYDEGGKVHRNTEPTNWFDVGDLARRYKTSVRHIYRLADAGRIPWGVKLGNLRRWSRREIEEWEAGGCQSVNSSVHGKVSTKKGGRHS